ncbi:hypothetical protein DE146DRAFT_62001 [Phaeosphaeria sp. MPI-PUGE-AT-0046c]|nr:hypothetical protein DE146DRAFT_62001 [Phaeosphaeria sp. MPI-PUGE-AT-0046c]
MTKRPTLASAVTDAPIKRQRTNLDPDDDAPTFHAPAEEFAPPEVAGDITLVEDKVTSNAEAGVAPTQDRNNENAVGDDTQPKSPAVPTADEPEDVVDENGTEPAATDAKTTAKKTKVPKQPPVKDAFDPWTPTITHPPTNDFWGIKPVTGDPRPHADQPSARDSDAATNPPLWEDRNYRFKRGSRYVKYLGPIKPEGADDGPDLDQENLLVMKLIDMRPKSKHDQSPRRTPTSYFFDAGKPKDWNNMQAIKALNDRRGQAIDRVTVDAPWSKIEREYLSQLLREHPEASIWELTERHNDRFMNKDFIGASGFTFTELSAGRTVESVRHEYMTYKPAYDGGEPPKGVRWRTDKSVTGNELRKRNANKTEQSFGKLDKKLEKEFDEAAEEHEEDGEGDESDGEGKQTTPKLQKKATVKKTPKKSPVKKSPVKKSKDTPIEATLNDSEDEDELQKQAVEQMAAQPDLDEEDEALLDLAGVNNSEEIRTFTPHVVPSTTTPRRTLSSSSGSDVSDVHADLSSQEAPTVGPKSADSRAPSLTQDTQPPQDLESPDAVEFNAAVSVVSEEAIAHVVANQQSKSANASAHQPSEGQIVVSEQSVAQHSVEVEHQSGCAVTPERSSPAPTHASKTPPPKAARVIDINDNYDDDDEEEDDDEEL